MLFTLHHLNPVPFFDLACPCSAGKYPKKLAVGGKYSKDFFNRRGELRHIHSLKYWALPDVLHEKYGLSKREAKEAADFLLPLLEFNPQVRHCD